MDWNRFEGNWKQLKGKVKAQWGKLTDDDLALDPKQSPQLSRHHIYSNSLSLSIQGSF